MDTATDESNQPFSTGNNSGQLFVVPTPIGNLKDITIRALEILQQVDTILAEDTRTSAKLLNHYNIKKNLVAFHQHNEHKMLPRIIDQLATTSMAIITDAGTPGISDPAFLLVRECIRHNIRVETLPGATAFVPALINSGLPTNRFCFEGFLPLKKGRHSLLTTLSQESRTMIFYESPVRLVKTLQDLADCFGPERQCCVSRELTKLFEENVRGSLQEVITYFQQKNVKGEIVIVVDGSKAN